MKKINTVLLLACLAVTLLSACSLTATRLFQAKVPAPVTKPAAQVEAERRSADLIARKIETPAELKPVAAALSQSLGAPAVVIVADKPEQTAHAAALATAELQTSIVTMQKQVAKLNADLSRYQGKEIEGTGFSILGPGMATLIICLIVLGVAFPPAFAIMAMLYRRLKAAGSIVVKQLEDSAKAPETAEAVEQIKSKISSAMKVHPQNTDALKNVILDLKKA